MTNREAIEVLEKHQKSFNAGIIELIVIDMAIQALEKQEPKKPIKARSFLTPRCPICNCEVENVLMQMSHCDHCGQAIDWSE